MKFFVNSQVTSRLQSILKLLTGVANIMFYPKKREKILNMEKEILASKEIKIISRGAWAKNKDNE